MVTVNEKLHKLSRYAKALGLRGHIKIELDHADMRQLLRNTLLIESRNDNPVYADIEVVDGPK